MNYAFCFRLIVSVLVATILLQAINWSDFAEIEEVRTGYLFIAGTLVFVDRFMNAYRWNILINDRSSTFSFTDILGIYFKSSFVGLITPSNVGGEFLKGYGLMKSGSGAIDSFSSIFVERLLGLIALLLTCLVGFIFFENRLAAIHAVVISRIFSAILALIFGALIISYFAFPLIARLLRPDSKITSLFRKVHSSLHYYQNIKIRLVLAFILSVFIQILRIYGIWFVGLGLGITLELSYYFLFVPVVALVSMMPVSIAGLGVQEGAFVYFFSQTGTNSAIILAMALVVRLFLVVSVLPGGVLYLRSGIGKKPQKLEGLKTHQ